MRRNLTPIWRNRAAPRRFGIFFTPRSGSTWLTDVLSGTGRLGRPDEWFNPDFVPGLRRAVNSRDLDSYVRLLQRRPVNTGGFFSYEMTILQLDRVFGSQDMYLSYFPKTVPLFYLRREDMVLQAVSLAKAVGSAVFHSASSTSEQIAAADAGFAYDGAAIRHWLDHILDQERRCEDFFARNGIAPWRLSYEQITGAGAARVARLFLRVLRPDEALPDLPEPETGHRKIGSRRNSDCAARFRAEYPGDIARIAAFRAQRPVQGSDLF